MTWAQNSSGEWVHTGTNRDVILWDAPVEQRFKIEYTFERIADKIMILLYPSRDARTCIEIGIASDAGASSSKLTIRTREDNVPSAPVYQADHNVPADTPFTLVVESDNYTYRATISTTGVDAVTLPSEGMATAGEVFEGNTGHAFASDVDGATIVSGGTRAGEPFIAVTNSPLVGYATGNGGVYYREATFASWALIRSGCFGPDDEISSCEYEGKVLFLAYNPDTRVSRAWKINVIERTCTTWNGLPGATGPGLTTARHVSSLFGRVWLDNDTGYAKSALPSYVEVGENAEDSWTNDPAEPGSAQYDNVGTGTGAGEPVLAMRPISSDAMAFFKKRSIVVVHGDEVLGAVYQTTISLEAGISGPKAITEVGKGTFYIHTPEGAYVVTIDGAIPLSKTKLRRYMDIGRDARNAYSISVQYDPRDAVVYYFLTQKTPSALIPRLHPVLDMKTSEYVLDQYVEDQDPMCACWYAGRVLMGDRDGYVRWFAPFGDSDDGRAFTAKYTVLLEDMDGVDGAIRLSRLSLQLATEAKYRLDTQSNTNGCAARIYGGQTAEDAILPNRRTLRAGPMVFNPGKQTHILNVADHALAIELTGTGNGFDWGPEDGEAIVSLASLGFSGNTVATKTIGSLCRPTFVGGTPTANVPPVANAGADQTLTDTDLNGEEIVTLDGSRSTDSDGFIVSYRWTDATGTVVGTTAICDVYQSEGTTVVYTLRVVDNAGASDTDTCTVTVNSGDPGGGGPVDPPGGGTSTTPAPGGGEGVVVDWISNPASVGTTTTGGEP